MKKMLYPSMALLFGVVLAWVVFACGKDRVNADSQVNSNLESTSRETEEGCYCEYRVISASVRTPLPNGFPVPVATLDTPNDICSVSSCKLMWANMALSGSCGSTGACVQNIYGAVDSTVWYPFNCFVPVFGDFEIVGSAAARDVTCANQYNGVTWNITYEVRCQGDEQSGCPEVYYYSGPVAIEGSGTGGQFQPKVFELEGCGCKPEL